MTSRDFKFQSLVVSKVSPHDIKKLKAKNYRITSYPLVPTQSKGKYLVPRKECLKYTKKLSFVINTNTDSKQAIKALRAFRVTKPSQFTFSISEVYKLIEKLPLLRRILTQMKGENLKCLQVNIQGGLVEPEIARQLQFLLIGSPNLRSLSLNLAKCSIKRDQTKMILDGIAWQAKLTELAYNSSYTDINDQEIFDLVEALANPLWNLQRFKALSICLKSNIRVTDEGMIALANFLARLDLLAFKCDLIGIGISDTGFKTLLDSLASNKGLEAFAINSREQSNIASALTKFLEAHKNLRNIELDLSHDSQIDFHALKTIQTSVAQLPKLVKYAFNVDGCPALGAEGTVYIADSLSMFESLKELRVQFASFIDGEDNELVVLPNIINSMAHLKQLEVLCFDFSSCSNWFVETDLEVQPKFLQAFSQLKNLKSLRLNFKKSHINSNSLEVLQQSLSHLKQLKFLELNLNFCKRLKEIDLKCLLLFLSNNLRLSVLRIYADDISYDENKLVPDLEMAVKASKTLKELNISLKKTLKGKQAANAMAKFMAQIPGFDLTLQGGVAFTVMLPGTVSLKTFLPQVKSRFGK